MQYKVASETIGASLGGYALWRKLQKCDLILPMMDLVITTRCTLRCKKCFHLIPSYMENGRHPFDVPLDTIKNDLDHFFNAIDFIIKINVLGGEPFLYADLDELLIYLAQFDKVGYFVLVSNGTIVPNDSTLEILQNPKYVILLNDYGINSERTREIYKKMMSYGVNCYIIRESIWYDFGDLSKKCMSSEELKHHYANCSYKRCKALMQGELHACAFHKHGQRNGLLPQINDSLHIHDYTAKELRDKIVEFYNTEYFEACDHCNAPIQGVSSEIPAGEQVNQ